ncbi:hypothetical protein [Streptomyces rhizosphaerihabitans]|uniref:hypothetical protein n=1 Tax=Streptomyces rhizosphaerihabitans TaxID=1266770 RepID=UPI0021C08398|nr:hypothetical protein [Streptomyces rhizosphaerihabitans]MCT9003873.1 hypothetical protein [Streptomyces rhizosphaerihabitans]
MPVIMLLRGLTRSLCATVRTLTPWLEIVDHESVVVERAHAAFLVHWWGFETPLTRLNLNGYIVNIGQLEEQFAAAQRSVPVSQGGPNATGSLLGLAGKIVGMALDPLYAVAGIYLVTRLTHFSWKTLILAVVWRLAPFALAVGMVVAPVGTGVLVGGGLAAAGFGYGLLVALGDRREVRAAYELFGSLTRLFIAVRDVIGQVLGDRMRNPLTAGLVIVGARLGRLFGQVLGAMAFLVVRVAPALAPVAALMNGLASLAGGAATAIGEVAADATSRVDGALSLDRLLTRVTGVLRTQLTAAGAAFGDGLRVLESALSTVGGKLTVGMLPTELGTFVGDLITGHPTVRVVTGLRTEADVFLAALDAAPKKAKKTPSEPSRLAPLIAALPELPSVKFPPLPSLPSLSSLPDVTVPPPAPVAEPPFVVRVPAVRVPAVTGLAVPELPRFLSAPVDLTPLKAIVDHLLPAALAGPVREKVDRLLSGFPVAELPESDVLRPVVRTLRLRVPGADPDDVRRFQDGLLARLRKQPYLTGAGG